MIVTNKDNKTLIYSVKINGGLSMDSILKLFTRCMACAVMVTPFCIFSSIDVQQAERPLSDVKFNFEKPAADFKKDFDSQAEQAMRVHHKKTATAQNQRFFSMLFNGLGALLGAAITVFMGILLIQSGGQLITGLLFYLHMLHPIIALLACMIEFGILCAVIAGPCIAYSCGASFYQELNNDLVFEPMFINKN